MRKIPKDIADIFEDVRARHYPKGQILLFQGDEPHEVFFLKKE